MSENKLYEEINRLKEENYKIFQELGLCKIDRDHAETMYKSADEAHSKLEADWFEHIRQVKKLKAENERLRNKIKTLNRILYDNDDDFIIKEDRHDTFMIAEMLKEQEEKALQTEEGKI